MPLRKQPKPLRHLCMLTLTRNWNLICYAVHSIKEMNELLESDGYLKYEGPFTNCPSTILEDMMECVRSKTNLSRKFLHLLMRRQLLKLNLSFGIGEIYYGLEFAHRCKRLRDLNLSYLRHVEPSHIIPILPHLSSLVSLHLGMTSANDILLKKLAEYCPNLHELNLQSTYISDDGLRVLCGYDFCGSSKISEGCLKLKRLTINDTRVTWLGAYEGLKNLPNLTDFDFDKIFQVFEHLDPTSVSDETKHPKLKLRSLYSSTPSIRTDSIDAAATLCPGAEILSISNCWMENDAFYRFMQFENLRTLMVSNSEGKTIDYNEGILPLMQIVGPNLENLILQKFEEVDLTSLGRSCPRLRKIALSSINRILVNPLGPHENIFTMLTNIELWMDEDTTLSSSEILVQLLFNATLVENLLVKMSHALDLSLLRKIWTKNPMKKLNRLMLDQCNNISGDALWELFSMENDLSTVRVWSCPKVTMDDRNRLKGLINSQNLSLYLEWFE